jgi:hypothetical protein
MPCSGIGSWKWANESALYSACRFSLLLHQQTKLAGGLLLTPPCVTTPPTFGWRLARVHSPQLTDTADCPAARLWSPVKLTRPRGLGGLPQHRCPVPAGVLLKLHPCRHPAHIPRLRCINKSSHGYPGLYTCSYKFNYLLCQKICYWTARYISSSHQSKE